MVRLLPPILLLVLLPAAALADKLVLVDGRTFTGTVKVQEGMVTIELTYGTLEFPKDEVASIEFKDTPEVELSKKLAEAPKGDANALFALGQWAGANDLKRRATDIYSRVLEIDPNHPAARRELGFIRVAGQWQTFDKAMELARSRLDAGELDTLVKDVLPILESAATAQQLPGVRDLLGQARLRAKDFAGAAKLYADLAEKAEGLAAVRFLAIAEILKEDPDGMYVVTEPYPPASDLLGSSKDAIKPGPASLARPEVLLVALRDRARKDIDAGRKLMEAAAKLEASDTEAAKGKYLQAAQSFDKADALVADISRSYRIEILRRRIASLRKDADSDAERFDKSLGELGRKNATPQQYREMVLKMIHHLDNVREDLHGILTLAKVYPRDLVMEISLAETNLKKIESMRKILAEELDGSK
jgi:hypothetical protein